MKNALGDPESVLVLGGGSDIAQATLRRLVRRRVRDVTLAARRPEQLAGVAEELRALGAADVRSVAFDADDVAAHPAFFAEAFGRGDVDVVLLTFGVLGDQQAAEKDPTVAVDVARTNYLGGVSAVMEAGKALVAQGHGTLVVLSSVAAERPRRSNFVYGSSKAGLDAVATGLGDALRGTGASVLVVRPGFVHTKMTADMAAVPFATTPDAVAEAIVRGLERGTETIWVPPILRIVMSVLRHVPRPVFRRLPL